MAGVFQAAAEAGATFSAYTFVRLNGAVKVLFHQWLYQNFPDRAEKVWHLIESGHGGKVSDSRWGVRMAGEGHIAKLVRDQYHLYTKKYGLGHAKMGLDCSRFQPPSSKGELWEQAKLF